MALGGCSGCQRVTMAIGLLWIQNEQVHMIGHEDTIEKWVGEPVRWGWKEAVNELP